MYQGTDLCEFLAGADAVTRVWQESDLWAAASFHLCHLANDDCALA